MNLSQQEWRKFSGDLKSVEDSESPSNEQLLTKYLRFLGVCEEDFDLNVLND